MDIAVTVVAAFGGGLAGAVLQPLAEYLLSRRRAVDERIRSDRRDARRLVEAHISAADLQGAFARRSGYGLEGDPAPEVRLNQLEQKLLDVWSRVDIRPVLLRDPELEEALREVDKVIWNLMYDARSLLRQGPAEERQPAAKRDQDHDRYNELRTRILERLDELGW